MTLDEYMKTAEGIVQIGCNVGYFFFGDRDEYFEQIDGISKEFYDRHLYNIKHNPQTPREDKTLEDFNFHNREVKETYHSFISGGTSVLIEGDEFGGYWDIDEWNETHGKPKIERKHTIADEQCANELANSIVLKALIDYKGLLINDYSDKIHEFVRGGLGNTGQHNKKEIQAFFESDWFRFLMPNTDGPSLLRRYEDKCNAIDIPEIPRVVYRTSRRGSHGGNYRTTQAYNGHVLIYRNDNIVYDDWETKRLTEKQLKAIFKKFYANFLEEVV